MWNPGEAVALRGLYDQRPCYVQSAIVVKDSPHETALLVSPGAECAAPSGYIHQKHGDHSHWERWQEMLDGSWQMETYPWRTNRFLILLKPQKFYATFYIWEQASGSFRGYYINFQLPFTRTPLGFDTFDLELDILISPDFRWKWKDVEDYQLGIETGILRPEWIRGIDTAKPDVFNRIGERLYPLDGAWLDWKPNPVWKIPCLPTGWEKA